MSQTKDIADLVEIAATEYARLSTSVPENKTTTWQTMDTAPRDTDVLVIYDHDEDPIQDPDNPERLTDYGAWTESGSEHLHGTGICIAKLYDAEWESEGYESEGYWMPKVWRGKIETHDFPEYEIVVNPIRWMPLPV